MIDPFQMGQGIQPPATIRPQSPSGQDAAQTLTRRNEWMLQAQRGHKLTILTVMRDPLRIAITPNME